MEGQIVYTNADKLLAVIDAWAGPMMAQLPAPYSYLAPAFAPVVGKIIRHMPDEAIPQAVNAIVDNAVNHGSLTMWNVTLDRQDLTQLQKLVRLNIPVDKCESEHMNHSGYKVITEQGQTINMTRV